MVTPTRKSQCSTAGGKKPLKDNLQKGFEQQSQDWRAIYPDIKYFV